MIQARAWPVRVMYILIAAALAIGLFVTAAPAHKVSAATDEVKAEWTIADTPTLEGWVLAPESRIIDFAYASEGDVTYAVVYAYDEAWTDQDYRLLKSDNGAATWTDLTDTLEKQVEDDGWGMIDELLRVETDNTDPNFLAVVVVVDSGWTATPVHVYISTDGGDTFIDTGEVEAGGNYFDGSPSLYGITDLAVSPEVDGKRDIAIGGGSANIGPGAAIFRCTVAGDDPGAWKDATLFTGWDSGVLTASWYVTFMEFSPNFETDSTILVTTAAYGSTNSSLTAIYLQCGSWGTTTPGWNDASTLGIDAVLVMDNARTIGIPATLYDPRIIAGLTLPSDYNSKSTDTRVLWVWVNYWDTINPASKIWLVDNDTVYPVGRQVKLGTVWLTNVSYYGTIAEGKAIAGVLGSGTDVVTSAGCEGVQVYRNTGIHNMDICCENWLKSCKPPTGMTAMAVAYVSQDKAYAVALQAPMPYDEGAWSVSFDDGSTWNQLSLVDTYIHYFSDVAVSPDCNKMWVVSVNMDEGPSCDSVWLKATTLPEAEEYSGQWLRVWSGEFMGYSPEWDDVAGFIRLPADETAGDTVFLVDYGSNNVYMNDLEGLACWTPIASATLEDIVDLAAPTADTLYALDSDGDVSMYDSEGWHEAVASKIDDGWTIAVHGNNSTFILVGGRFDGDVSVSEDGGATFALLKDDLDHDVMTPIPGHVTVAFDTYFDTNDVIYAAVEGWGGDDMNGGIYSWVLGTSTDWKDLGADHSNSYTGLVVSFDATGNPFTSPETGGVLYASYVHEDSPYEAGVARCLAPIVQEQVCETCPAEWDYLTESNPEDLFYGDVWFEAAPRALKMCGCLGVDTNTKLFAIDTGYDYNMVDGTYSYEDYTQSDMGGAVWTFEDCYAKKAVELVSPADGFAVGTSTCGCCNVPFVIKWDRVCDACCYEIEFAYDAAFTEPFYPYESAPITDQVDRMIDFTDYCPGSVIGPAAAANPSAFLGCYFQPETTYYWRVRAIYAGTGQYIRSWWSDAQSFTVAPTPAAGAIELVAPTPGALNVPPKNLGFSWHLLATADAFDWVLSKNADLSAPVQTKTGLTGTATSYAGTLDYGTTYYWQVIAYNNGAAISTSAVGTFTTAATGAFCSAIDGMCFATQAELAAHNAEVSGHAAPTPFWVWVVIAIGAVLVIVVIVLIFRTRRV